MCDIKKYEKLYQEIEKLKPEDTLQLVLEAETEEQREFYEVVGDFLLQKKQKKVIERNIFWWKNTRKAKEMGYCIEMHYVGVDSVEIAKERVKIRVDKGGHGISEADIEKRYVETFCNLKEVLKDCNLAAFYDNTEGFRRFAIFQNGKAVRLSHVLPKWIEGKGIL